MNTENKTKRSRFGTFLILALAAIFVVTTLAIAGCNNSSGNESSPSPSPSETNPDENQSVSNGNFNLLYDTSEGTDYPRSPKNWTQNVDGSGATKAPSSSDDLLYGVINVNSDKFDPNVTEDSNGKKKFGDLDNPLSPNKDEEDKGNVLMLYNKRETALNYKSSSISVPANAYIKVSVWVKTVGLDKNEPAYAYMALTGGLEEPLYFRNITTFGVTDSETTPNGYVKYSFYIEGSAYQSKTVYLTLGLGYGDKLSAINHTTGYAFFDDVEMEYLYAREFPASFDADLVRADGHPFDFHEIDLKGTTAGSKSFGYSFVKSEDGVLTSDREKLDKILNFGTGYETYANIPGYEKGSSKYGKASDLSAEDEKELLKNAPFGDGQQYLMLKNGTRQNTGFRYTADWTASDSLNPYKYYRVSMWVKTTEFRDSTGLNIVLSNGLRYTVENANDYKKLTSFANINTPKNDRDLTDDDVMKDYRQENWQQYTFYLKTSTSSNPSNFGIEFYLGPQFKDETDETFDWKIAQGYALITAPTVEELTKTEYDSTSTGDYAKQATLGASTTTTKNTNTISNGDFTTPTNAFGNYDFTNGPLAPKSWQDNPHGSVYAGGDDKHQSPSSSYDLVSGMTDRLLVTDGNGKYTTGATFSGTPYKLGIKNLNATGTALGYASDMLSMSANSTYKLSVRVAGKAGTKFGIYLIGKGNNAEYLGDGGYTETGKDEDGDPIYEKNTRNDNLYFEGTIPQDKDVYMLAANNGNVVPESAWTTYTFYFKTKDEAKNFRLELWLGDRDYDTEKEDQSAAYTTGEIYFANAQLNTLSASTEYDKYVVDTSESSDGVSIKDTDADGNPVADYLNIKKVDYSFSDIAEETDPTESPSESEDSSGEQAPFNWAPIAAGGATLLMVIALLIVLIRKFVAKGTHKKGGPDGGKNKPVKNVYTGTKKHYEKTEADNAAKDVQEPEDEAAEDAEQPEAETDETEEPADDADDEESLDLPPEIDETASDIVDEDEDDKKDLD